MTFFWIKRNEVSKHCDTLIPCALEIFLLTYLLICLNNSRGIQGHSYNIFCTDGSCMHSAVLTL